MSPILYDVLKLPGPLSKDWSGLHGEEDGLRPQIPSRHYRGTLLVLHLPS